MLSVRLIKQTLTVEQQISQHDIKYMVQQLPMAIYIQYNYSILT